MGLHRVWEQLELLLQLWRCVCVCVCACVRVCVCVFLGGGAVSRFWPALAVCRAHAGSQVARAAALHSIVVCGKRVSNCAVLAGSVCVLCMLECIACDLALPNWQGGAQQGAALAVLCTWLQRLWSLLLCVGVSEPYDA
jgi:hypothetical protein